MDALTLKPNKMISGSIFSMADLNNNYYRLFANIILNKVEVICEIIEENEESGTTEIRLEGNRQMFVKTKSLYNLKNYNTKIERAPF